MSHATVTSGPVEEHNDGRLDTIGLGPKGPTPPSTHDDGRRQITNDLFHERSGILWNLIMGLMERNNYEHYHDDLSRTGHSQLEIG